MFRLKNINKVNKCVYETHFYEDFFFSFFLCQKFIYDWNQSFFNNFALILDVFNWDIKEHSNVDQSSSTVPQT